MSGSHDRDVKSRRIRTLDFLQFGPVAQHAVNHGYYGPVEYPVPQFEIQYEVVHRVGPADGIRGFHAAGHSPGQAIVGKPDIIDQRGQLVAELGMDFTRRQKVELEGVRFLIGVQGAPPHSGQFFDGKFFFRRRRRTFRFRQLFVVSGLHPGIFR